MTKVTTSGFEDSRTHGFARVAVCIPKVHVADPARNASSHLKYLKKVYREGAVYALCPELGLSAYTCGDLFFDDTLQRSCEDALGDIAVATEQMSMLLSVGLPIRVGSLLLNCAVTLYRGKPVAVTPKSFLPNYREFYEQRWFAAAKVCTTPEIELIGEVVPIGSDIIVEARHIPGFALHTEICEDLWVPIPPSARAALSGATVLANLSASNITVAKSEYRRTLVIGSSARNLAVQMYAAAGFGESTADLAWDGEGLIAERGHLLSETERFSLAGSSAIVDVDLGAVAQDRMRQTSFADNVVDAGATFRRIVCGEGEDAREPAVYNSFLRVVDPHPFVPADSAKRDERCREVFSIQATSLARRLEALPDESRRLVIGVSGGQDSTHALLVAARAVDLLGLPRDRILAITMPGLGTTDRTRNNARHLSEALGARLHEVPIGELSEEVFRIVEHPSEVEDLTFENVQAWLRKLLLFSMASRHRALDLGTGDLSELALGWCTYGGDHMSHYGVNAGVPKTLITYLIRWATERVFGDDKKLVGVLMDILATPISPELKRPDGNGEIAQRSEDVIGPYELHDFFLYHFLRFGAEPGKIARLCLHAFDGRYDLATIRRWLIVFLERFVRSQYKRDCLPGGPKVGSGGALSPRGDWRMPADATADIWLEAARRIPEQLPQQSVSDRD